MRVEDDEIESVPSGSGTNTGLVIVVAVVVVVVIVGAGVHCLLEASILRRLSPSSRCCSIRSLN